MRELKAPKFVGQPMPRREEAKPSLLRAAGCRRIIAKSLEAQALEPRTRLAFRAEEHSGAIGSRRLVDPVLGFGQAAQIDIALAKVGESPLGESMSRLLVERLAVAADGFAVPSHRFEDPGQHAPEHRIDDVRGEDLQQDARRRLEPAGAQVDSSVGEGFFPA